MRKLVALLAVATACGVALVAAFVRAIWPQAAPVQPAPQPAASVAPPSPAPRTSLFEMMRGWFVGVTVTIALIAFAVAVVAVVIELVEDSITIESFSVPPSFDGQGSSGRVLALRFIDELSDMNRVVEVGVPRKSFTADWQRKAIDLPVPEMNTNLHSIVSVIRHMVGVEQQSFTCEIVDGGAGALRVRARLTGRRAFARDYAAGTQLDTIIGDLARHFCKQSQPVVYAAYQCGRRGPGAAQECDEGIRAIMANSDRIDAMWALNFLAARQKETSPRGAIRTYGVAIAFGCEAKSSDMATVCAYVLANRAGVYLGDDTRDAVADLERANRLRPNDRGILTNLAIAYERAGNPQRALRAYTAAFAAAPGDVRALVNRGTLRAAMNDFDAAIADFNEAIRINPTFAPAYLSRAGVYQRRERHDDAEKDFEMTVVLDPEKLPDVERARGIELAQVNPLEMRP